MQPQHQSDEPQIMVSIKFTHKLITAQKITADPQNKVRKKKTADWWEATEEGGKERVHLILLLFVDKQDLRDMGESV